MHKSLAMIAALLAGGFFTGCTSTATNSQPLTGNYHVEASSQSRVKVFWVKAHKDGDDLVVRGNLRRHRFGTVTYVRGHVDVDIRSADGKLLHQATNIPHKPVRLRKFPHMATFKARIPGDPPKGSEIHVRYHLGSHGEKGNNS